MEGFAQQGIEAVPAEGRRLGFWDSAVLWGDLGIGLLVLLAGSFLVPALSPGQALAAIVMGSVIAFALQSTKGGAMATILLVEDERDIVELVRYHLEKDGMRCRHAPDGVAGLRLIRAEPPDLVILDLVLPGLDGLEVCRRLRQDPATRHLPIIMLTAKADEVDRVVGLEVGADDYVVKPFSPRELVARVRAVLRRAGAPDGSAAQRAGDLVLDEARHAVTVQGRPVEFTAKEFGLLAALMRARGRVLSREQLLESVWGHQNAAEIESRTVDVHIRRLREKLGPEARRIVSVKAVGYRFEPGP